MPNLDPAIDADLQREILVSRIGENPSQPAGATASFFEEVYRFCVRYMATASVGDGAIAFALSEHGIDVDPVYEEHHESFKPSGRLDLDKPPPSGIGPVVLTTRNLRMTYSSQSEESDALGVAKRLKSLGLGSRPTAVFVPGQRLLTLYPTGVEQKAALNARTDAMAALDASNLDEVLTYFHQNYTRYPTGFGTCWDNATNRVVERNAERNVRNHLFLFLGFVIYRSKYVVREYDRPNGRIDIFIFGIAMNEPDRERVLELKVLRSRSIGWTSETGKKRSYSDASNQRYVERGLRQTKRYVESTSAADAFLLCFDARLDDVDVPIQAYADELGITFRRYYMESSANEE